MVMRTWQGLLLLHTSHLVAQQIVLLLLSVFVYQSVDEAEDIAGPAAGAGCQADCAAGTGTVPDTALDLLLLFFFANQIVDGDEDMAGPAAEEEQEPEDPAAAEAQRQNAWYK
jgi:hypothetical protein